MLKALNPFRKEATREFRNTLSLNPQLAKVSTHHNGN
jgi:hypothetical protein